MDKRILEYYTFAFMQNSEDFPGETIALGYAKGLPTFLVRIDSNVDLLPNDVKNVLEVICSVLDLKEYHREKSVRISEIKNKHGSKLAVTYPLVDDDPLNEYSKLELGGKTINLNIAIIDKSDYDDSVVYYDIVKESFKPEGILPYRNEELPFYIYNLLNTSQLSSSRTIQ